MKSADESEPIVRFPPPPPPLPPPAPCAILPPPPPPPPLQPHIGNNESTLPDKNLKESLKRMLENRLQPKTDENDVKFRFYFPLSGDTYVIHSFPPLPLPDLSYFQPSLPTKVVAHGNKGLTDTDLLFNQAYRQANQGCNLIGIDWRDLEGSAQLRVEQAGRQTARLLEKLSQDCGLNFQDIHMIGFSYGAHVVANASKELQRLGKGRIPRITALDPGRHGFDQESAEKLRLTKEDAELVDVIHTSRIGFLQAIGHVDFFPNGGESQVIVIYCSMNTV